MRINIANNYILCFPENRKTNLTALKIMRVAANLRQQGEEIITVPVQTLMNLMGEDGKVLYNKHREYKEYLEELRIHGERMFRTVSYSEGKYIFECAPGAIMLPIRTGSYIYYESEILGKLKTSYALYLYENIKQAQLKDPRPTLTIARPETYNIYDFRRLMERQVQYINQTELEITSIEIETKEKKEIIIKAKTK